MSDGNVDADGVVLPETVVPLHGLAGGEIDQLGGLEVIGVGDIIVLPGREGHDVGAPVGCYSVNPPLGIGINVVELGVSEVHTLALHLTPLGRLPLVLVPHDAELRIGYGQLVAGIAQADLRREFVAAVVGIAVVDRDGELLALQLPLVGMRIVGVHSDDVGVDVGNAKDRQSFAPTGKGDGVADATVRYRAVEVVDPRPELGPLGLRLGVVQKVHIDEARPTVVGLTGRGDGHRLAIARRADAMAELLAIVGAAQILADLVVGVAVAVEGKRSHHPDGTVGQVSVGRRRAGVVAEPDGDDAGIVAQVHGAESVLPLLVHGLDGIVIAVLGCRFRHRGKFSDVKYRDLAVPLTLDVRIQPRGTDVERRRGRGGRPKRGRGDGLDLPRLLGHVLHRRGGTARRRGRRAARRRVLAASGVALGAHQVISLPPEIVLHLLDALLHVPGGAVDHDPGHEGNQQSAEGDEAVAAAAGQPELQLLLQPEVLVGGVGHRRDAAGMPAAAAAVAVAVAALLNGEDEVGPVAALAVAVAGRLPVAVRRGRRPFVVGALVLHVPAPDALVVAVHQLQGGHGAFGCACWPGLSVPFFPCYQVINE